MIVAAIGAAEQAHGELGAAGAHQPGDADDLAAADMEVDVLDDLPVGMQRMIDRPVLDLEHHLADLGLALRIAVARGRGRPCLRMMRSSLDRAAAAVQRLDGAPSRSTVMRSATRATSLSLCEIRIEEMPCALNSSSRSSSACAVAFVQARGRLVEDQQLAPPWTAPWRSRPAAACRRRYW